MATISNLVVKITGDNKKLKNALKGSIGSVSDFAKKASKALAGVALVVTGALTVAFTGLVGAINRTADEIDDLAKTSDKLGIMTQELQKLQFQANLTGVSTNTLNMGLQRMVRRVSEAAKGTGEAKNALKELGLDAKALNQLAPDKQFQAISKAMQQIPTQADKVRLAMRLFDTEGVALVNTLNSSLDQSSKEFDKLGVAITRQQAAAVEAYNDSVTKLQALWQGFLNQLTVQVAPAFQSLIDWIRKTVMEMGGMGAVAKAAAGVIINIVQNIIRVMNKLLDVIDQVIIGFKQIQRLKTLAVSFADVANPIRAVGNLIKVAKGERVGSFKEREEIDKQIAEIRNRISTRGEVTQRAIQQAEAAKLDITVKADKDSVVEDITVSNEIKALIRKVNAEQVGQQARINDR